jgi:hypothetical protein
MKIALYIEDGLEQIVLTPTSETEKAILEKIHDGTRQLSIKRGEFYGCRGGWTRQKKRYPNYGGFGSDEPNDESTMIILHEPASGASSSGGSSHDPAPLPPSHGTSRDEGSSAVENSVK